MSLARAVEVAIVFVWLGMVLAISFLEAPLKFRAPNVSLQIVAVRPRLTRRSDQVLAGLDAPRSRGHYVYIGLEAIKVLALAVVARPQACPPADVYSGIVVQKFTVATS